MYVSFHSRLNTAKDVSLLCSSSVSLASAVAFLTGRGRLGFLLRQTRQISFCLRRSFILSKCSLCFPPHLVNSCRELPGAGEPSPCVAFSVLSAARPSAVSTASLRQAALYRPSPTSYLAPPLINNSMPGAKFTKQTFQHTLGLARHLPPVVKTQDFH